VRPGRRESVPPDSCVWRSEKPVCGSAQAFGAKFFSAGELRAAGIAVRTKVRPANARGVRVREKVIPRDAAKTRYPWAFPRSRDFSRAFARMQRIFSAQFYRAHLQASRGARGAALTHKIKQSHCYFFPAVVIGCQCWSIRDRTASMIAIHSS